MPFGTNYNDSGGLVLVDWRQGQSDSEFFSCEWMDEVDDTSDEISEEKKFKKIKKVIDNYTSV